MMGAIYQYAQTVFVWLDCEADGSPKVSTETRDLVKRRVFWSSMRFESVRQKEDAELLVLLSERERTSIYACSPLFATCHLGPAS